MKNKIETLLMVLFSAQLIMCIYNAGPACILAALDGFGLALIIIDKWLVSKTKQKMLDALDVASDGMPANGYDNPDDYEKYLKGWKDAVAFIDYMVSGKKA